jgi:hypothetical protein
VFVLTDLVAWAQVINRSPQYRNRFVHRRGSISLDGVSSPELEERSKIGLVVNADESSDEGADLNYGGADCDDEDDDSGFEEGSGVPSAHGLTGHVRGSLPFDEGFEDSAADLDGDTVFADRHGSAHA